MENLKGCIKFKHISRDFGVNNIRHICQCGCSCQEYEIDKTLGIKGPEDVFKLGISEYNKQCRSIVMRYASEWEVSSLPDDAISCGRTLCFPLNNNYPTPT